MSKPISSESSLSKLSSNTMLKTIMPAGFVAGTLDILAAIAVYAGILGVTSAARILQLIASGVFGKSSFDGGIKTAAAGLIFHYVIACAWTAAFVFMFPRAAFLRNHKIIACLLYGALVWLLMNLVVLPLGNAPQAAFKWDSVLIGVVILMFCISLPISLVTHRRLASRTAAE